MYYRKTLHCNNKKGDLAAAFLHPRPRKRGQFISSAFFAGPFTRIAAAYSIQKIR